MRINWRSTNRKIHYWGALACALPIFIVLISGLLLQVKKESDWIQPPTSRGSDGAPTLTLPQVLERVKTVPEAGVASWSDIDRLDVRPSKGLIKVRTNNRWEVQLDHASGEILQVAYRRTDLIESLHDGSFFSDTVKLWVFLPAAIILTTLWVTGVHLFLITWFARRRHKLKKQQGQKFRKQANA